MAEDMSQLVAQAHERRHAGPFTPKAESRLTHHEQRRLIRDIAGYFAANNPQREQMYRELSASWQLPRNQVASFAKRHDADVRQVQRDLQRGIDERFAGMWIASQEDRIAAYMADYERSLANEEWRDHYEHIRTRTDILRKVAEELGQLPPRQQVIVVPVQHVVVGIDVQKELT